MTKTRESSLIFWIPHLQVNCLEFCCLVLLSMFDNPLQYGEGESVVGLQKMQLCFLLPDFPCVLVMIAEVYYIGLVSASCCWLSRLMCLFTIKLSSAVKGSQHLITFWVCTPKPPPQERRRGSPWLAKCRWAQKVHVACSDTCSCECTFM